MHQGLGGNDDGATGSESTGSLAETTGNVVGTMTSMGGLETLIFCLSCISKSPVVEPISRMNQCGKQGPSTILP